MHHRFEDPERMESYKSSKGVLSTESCEVMIVEAEETVATSTLKGFSLKRITFATFTPGVLTTLEFSRP